MKLQKTKAFTLVELIIVITILAILATIGFMSFQSYTRDARDGQRKADLTQLSKGLEIYQTKNAVLPDPDEQTVTIMTGGLTISIQGYAGTTVLQKLRATEMIDSSDKSYYTYTVNGDKTKYQLLSMLENNTNLAKINIPLDKAYAVDYNSRYPYTRGNKVGIFFSGTTNIPLQETKSGSIDLAGAYSGTTFKVMFTNSISNSGTISSTGINLPAQIQTITNSTASSIPVASNPGVKTVGFSTTLYTGNGSTQPITTGVDISSQWGSDPSQKFGGLVWIKSRNSAAGNRLFDTIRPLDYAVYSNLANIQTNDTGLTDISTKNNINVALGGGGTNGNSVTYASWIFQTTNISSGTTNQGKNYTCAYNPYTGFTMIKYVGSGNVGHEIPNCLGRKLGFVTIKNLDQAVNWISSTSSFTKDEFISLNLTNAKATSAYQYVELTDTNVIVPSSTSSLGSNGNVNASGNNYIMYGWANSYYDASSNLVGNYEIGTYNGTGVSGNKITTRGKPAWVMLKRLDSTGSQWYVFDNKRDDGVYQDHLYPNQSYIEETTQNLLYKFSNDGFVHATNAAEVNASGGQYLYMVVYDNDNGSGKSTYMLK